jgi:hypothetical protein
MIRMLNWCWNWNIFYIVTRWLGMDFTTWLHLLDVTGLLLRCFMIIIVLLISTISSMLLIWNRGLCIFFKLLFGSVSINSISFKIFGNLMWNILWWKLCMNFSIFFHCSKTCWLNWLMILPFMFRNHYILATHRNLIIYIYYYFKYQININYLLFISQFLNILYLSCIFFYLFVVFSFFLYVIYRL